jgi:hypothetical protein
MRLDLEKYTVTIKDSIGWGLAQEVQAVVESGVKVGPNGFREYDTRVLLESKYKLLEICVTRIFEKAEGDQPADAVPAEIPFSREWMNGLSIQDGDTLYEACNDLTKKK